MGRAVTALLLLAAAITTCSKGSHSMPIDPGRPIPDPNLPPRTRVEVATGSGVWQQTTNPNDILVVENKDFVFTGDISQETNDGCCGVFALGPFAEVRVSNCSFSGFRQGIVVQGFEVGGVPTFGGLLHVKDSEVYSTVKQGLYVSQYDEVKIRRTHFIECGESTLFDHAIYIQADCGPDVLVADCAMVAAGSHAAQLRSGGTMHGNFVARCPIGLQVGVGNNPKPGGVYGSVYDNVVAEGVNITPALPRGMGFIVGNVNAVVMANNLCWQNAGNDPCSLWLNGDGVAGQPGVGVHNVTGHGNRVLNWKWGLRMDGVVTGFTSSAWGPSAPMPDTDPVLSLDALLGHDWINKLRYRELTAPQCISAVLGQVP